VDVMLAEIGGRVMTSENRQDLSRPKTAVRDRLNEVRRRLAEACDRWHGNTGGSFNA
jgi:hypothetical protein